MSGRMRRIAILTLTMICACAAIVAARCPAAELLLARPAFNAHAVSAQRTALEKRVRTALEEFDAELASLPPVTTSDWHAYLKWETWAKPLLENGAWDAPAMKRICWRLYTAEKGFENPLILQLRTALTDYLSFDEAMVQAHGDLRGEYERRFDQLGRAFAASELDFRELEAATWWLAATGQAPQAVAQVRAQFNEPSVVVQVHRELVEARLGQFENETREVRSASHQIQGATVVGQSTVTSRTTAELVDETDDARLHVVSTGQVVAPRNTSHSGRVSVSSSANSQFTVTADIFWNGQQFAITTPQATADTRSTIRGINAPFPIRRIAARRVHSSRPAAQREAEELIKREAVEAMTKRMTAGVERINGRTENFLAFLTRTGNQPHQLGARVRETSVQIGLRAHSLSGLGAAPHEMPPMVGEQTIGLSFHDAGIEGIFRQLLAGKVWTDTNFSAMQRELTGGNSEEMLIGLEPGRWNVQWAWRQPIRFHFTRDFATVRYQFSRVEIDGAAYDIPFEVCARMTLAAPSLGFEMTLLEPPTVTSIDPQQPLPPHFQAFLEHKFGGLFGEHFSLDGMQFPAGGALNGMSVFRVSAISLEPHWVHLRYTHRRADGTLATADPIAAGTAAPTPSR